MAHALMTSPKTDFPPTLLMYQMMSLLNICGLCLWLYLASQSSKKVFSQNTIQGTVYVDGSASIATTDEDFICATVDWWPPEKCDYGTCSWGTASLLNLPGITVLLINLDGNTTMQVGLSVANAVLNNTATLQFPQHRKGKFAMLRFGPTMREEYHLTPKDGDIHSQTVLLNGKVLAVDSSGMIPPLEPKRANLWDPIIVDPFSIVFVDISTIIVPACK